MYKNLFIARKENRMTQEETGKLVGLSKQGYHLKESGKTDFRVKEAQMLAKFFNTTVDYLFAE